jgi:hypothetical protein
MKTELLFYLLSPFCLETGSFYVVQADLDLMSLLPLPPKCWDLILNPS